MNTPRDPSAELDQLLMALVDGELTHVQQQHLSALLRDDPALQAKYRDYLLLDSLLRWEQPEAARPAPEPVRRRWGTRWALVSALAASILAVVALWWHRSGPEPIELTAEPTDDSVAVLLQAPGAVWDPADPPRQAGAALAPGWLRLKSGVAHIEFYNGATVILEGPAEFSLISRTRAYCASGKLRATVPAQANGFTIGTPSVDVVDRGTEFGLRVDGNDKAEVHVFQGKVDMYGPNDAAEAPPQTALKTGQGLRMDGAAGTKPITPDPGAFLTAQTVTARSLEALRKRQGEWAVASAALRRDPTLLVYYPFEPDAAGPRTVRDQAGERREPRDGAIVGCAWAPGRWTGKQGLEFKHVSDRVRLYVPGELDSITLAAWVRVDALPNRNNALFMVDAWEPGALHWQIGDVGKLVLGVQGPDKKVAGQYHALDVFTPARFGRWSHLAVVYDRDAGQVTHYVDGQPAARVPTQFDIPLRVGNAEIGNWNSATHRDSNPIRHLTGCMDEFMLFSRALTDSDVERLYTQGRPPS